MIEYAVCQAQYDYESIAHPRLGAESDADAFFERFDAGLPTSNLWFHASPHDIAWIS